MTNKGRTMAVAIARVFWWDSWRKLEYNAIFALDQ